MGQEIITRLNDGSIDSQMLIGLIDMGIKGLLLMAAAGLAAAAMRKHAAAARHLVWLLALCGLLLLPVFTALMPRWTLPLPPKRLPAPTESPVQMEPFATPTLDSAEWKPPTQQEVPVEVPTAYSEATLPSQSESAVAVPGARLPERIAPLFFGLWIGIATSSLSSFLAGQLAISRLKATSLPFDSPKISRLVKSVSATLGLPRPPAVRMGPSGSMPMATGLFRPIIYLPREAMDWPEAKLRTVLAHELAHVKRRDCLTYALARAAVALHWYNPLGWIALRQMRVEREHACDDLVIKCGERPSSYAEVLLEIAQSMRTPPNMRAAAVTMARKSHIEERLRAILDGTRNRSLLTKRLIAVSAISAISLLVILSSTAFERSTIYPPLHQLVYASDIHVEVVLVSSAHPEEAKREYWKPDGGTLPERPQGFQQTSWPDLEGGNGANRLIGLELKLPFGTPPSPPIKLIHDQLSYAQTTTTYENGGHVELWAFIAAPEGESTTDFDLGVATGPWRTIAQARFGEDVEYRSFDKRSRRLVVGEPVEGNGVNQFYLIYPAKEDQYRAVGVKHDGERIVFNESVDLLLSSEQSSSRSFFLNKYAPKDFSHLELQVRDCEWRTFHGIALNPADPTVAARLSEASVESGDNGHTNLAPEHIEYIEDPGTACSWGPEVDGLQAAFRLKSDQTTVVLDEVFDMEYLIRNSGATPVSFFVDVPCDAGTGSLINQHGLTEPSEGHADSKWVSSLGQIRLQPGQVAVVPLHGYAIMDKRKFNKPERPITRFHRALPGPHELSFAFEPPLVEPSTPPESADFAPWRGTLHTGKKSITLVTREQQPQAAASLIEMDAKQLSTDDLDRLAALIEESKQKGR